MTRSKFRAGAVLFAASGVLLAAGCTNPVSRDAMIRYNLSPELDTLYQRPVDVANTMALMSDQNRRMMLQDLGRFWYTDRASRLTREPIPH